jgi:(2Fe-2S) ferredoxin
LAAVPTVVDQILRTGSRDAAHIERILDGLLDFCGHEPVLVLFRHLCRHYWTIDPAAAAEYIRGHRERREGVEDDIPLPGSQ